LLDAGQVSHPGVLGRHMEHLTKVGLQAMRKKEPLKKTKFKRDPKKVIQHVLQEKKAEIKQVQT